jgi:hypothetical protein
MLSKTPSASSSFPFRRQVSIRFEMFFEDHADANHAHRRFSKRDARITRWRNSSLHRFIELSEYVSCLRFLGS